MNSLTAARLVDYDVEEIRRFVYIASTHFDRCNCWYCQVHWLVNGPDPDGNYGPFYESVMADFAKEQGVTGEQLRLFLKSAR